MIYVQIFVRLRAVSRIFRIRRKELVGYCKVFPRIDIRNQKYQDKASVRTLSVTKFQLPEYNGRPREVWKDK
jgi:hypothetical protein